MRSGAFNAPRQPAAAPSSDPLLRSHIHIVDGAAAPRRRSSAETPPTTGSASPNYPQAEARDNTETDAAHDAALDARRQRLLHLVLPAAAGLVGFGLAALLRRLTIRAGASRNSTILSLLPALAALGSTIGANGAIDAARRMVLHDAVQAVKGTRRPSLAARAGPFANFTFGSELNGSLPGDPTAAPTMTPFEQLRAFVRHSLETYMWVVGAWALSKEDMELVADHANLTQVLRKTAAFVPIGLRPAIAEWQQQQQQPQHQPSAQPTAASTRRSSLGVPPSAGFSGTGPSPSMVGGLPSGMVVADLGDAAAPLLMLPPPAEGAHALPPPVQVTTPVHSRSQSTAVTPGQSPGMSGAAAPASTVLRRRRGVSEVRAAGPRGAAIQHALNNTGSRPAPSAEITPSDSMSEPHSASQPVPNLLDGKLDSGKATPSLAAAQGLAGGMSPAITPHGSPNGPSPHSHSWSSPNRSLRGRSMAFVSEQANGTFERTNWTCDSEAGGVHGVVLSLALGTKEHALEGGPLDGLIPSDVADGASRLLGVALEVITRSGGVVHHFDLDSLVATFNVQTRVPDYCLVAADCAITLAYELMRLEEVEEVAASIGWGMGLAEGLLLAGHTGTNAIRTVVVCGAAVAAADDLAKLNFKLTTSILMTQNFHDRVQTHIRSLLVDFVCFRPEVVRESMPTASTSGSVLHAGMSFSNSLHGSPRNAGGALNCSPPLGETLRPGSPQATKPLLHSRTVAPASQFVTGVYQLLGDLSTPGFEAEELALYMRGLVHLRQAQYTEAAKAFATALNNAENRPNAADLDLTQFRRQLHLAEAFEKSPELAPPMPYSRCVHDRWVDFIDNGYASVKSGQSGSFSSPLPGGSPRGKGDASFSGTSPFIYRGNTENSFEVYESAARRRSGVLPHHDPNSPTRVLEAIQRARSRSMLSPIRVEDVAMPPGAHETAPPVVTPPPAAQLMKQALDVVMPSALRSLTSPPSASGSRRPSTSAPSRRHQHARRRRGFASPSARQPPDPPRVARRGAAPRARRSSGLEQRRHQRVALAGCRGPAANDGLRGATAAGAFATSGSQPHPAGDAEEIAHGVRHLQLVVWFDKRCSACGSRRWR
jgi:hypothetical protein